MDQPKRGDKHQSLGNFANPARNLHHVPLSTSANGQHFVRQITDHPAQTDFPTFLHERVLQKYYE